MKRSTLILATLIALIACGPSQAQQPPNVVTPTCPFGANGDGTCKPDPAAPKLSEQAKLELRLAFVTAENLQLKAQQLAMEYNRSQQALQALIAKYTPEGYVIDNNLELVKAPAPEKKDKGKGQ